MALTERQQALCDESDTGNANILSRSSCLRRGRVVGVPRLVLMKYTSFLMAV